MILIKPNVKLYAELKQIPKRVVFLVVYDIKLNISGLMTLDWTKQAM